MKQIMEFNPKLVIKMWHYLIENNMDIIKNDKSSYGVAYRLLASMLFELHDNHVFIALEPMIIEDKLLIDIIFGETPDYTRATAYIIGDTIKLGKLSVANRMLELMYENKYVHKGLPFFTLLKNIIEEHLLVNREHGSCLISSHSIKEYSSDVQNLIKSWIDKIYFV
jgi:hypothetical protein